VDLLLKMMAMESSDRPSADEILSSDYFKDYKAPLPNNNIVNNNNLNNSLSDSESGSHSMPKPLSNGHMNVPPTHPAPAKSPQRDMNQKQANDSNNSNANGTPDAKKLFSRSKLFSQIKCEKALLKWFLHITLLN
jgi:serine/threonine protein kinase